MTSKMKIVLPDYPPAATARAGIANPRQRPGYAAVVRDAHDAAFPDLAPAPEHPDRTCTPCALAHDRRTLATHVVTGHGTRPMEHWACAPCAAEALGSLKATRITPIGEWFAAARETWDAADTVAALKGKPCP